MNEYNRAVQAAWNRTLLLIPGWISALISIIIFPFIFGAIGVVIGIFATRNSNRAGVALIWASMVCMAAGVMQKAFF